MIVLIHTFVIACILIAIGGVILLLLRGDGQ